MQLHVEGRRLTQTFRDEERILHLRQHAEHGCPNSRTDRARRVGGGWGEGRSGGRRSEASLCSDGSQQHAAGAANREPREDQITGAVSRNGGVRAMLFTSRFSQRPPVATRLSSLQSPTIWRFQRGSSSATCSKKPSTQRRGGCGRMSIRLPMDTGLAVGPTSWSGPMRFSGRHDAIIQADSFFSRSRGGSVVRSTCTDMPSKGSDLKCPQVDMSGGLEGLGTHQKSLLGEPVQSVVGPWLPVPLRSREHRFRRQHLRVDATCQGMARGAGRWTWVDVPGGLNGRGTRGHVDPTTRWTALDSSGRWVPCLTV